MFNGWRVPGCSREPRGCLAALTSRREALVRISLFASHDRDEGWAKKNAIRLFHDLDTFERC